MLVGTKLRNRYYIARQLGSGGFGDTYLAEDRDLPGNPQCVVKHLKPNSDPGVLQVARRLFDTEAQILFRLGNDHNQIPQLFAHFEENGEFYLVQEFIDGHDLTRELTPDKRLNEAQAVKLLQEILEVLVFVHENNVIHRDIKPQNLMRRRRDGKIVLIDFGAVKEIRSLMVNAPGQTSATVGVGTPGYMPSEQARGRPKLCSDIYAVGMIGIQALTGIRPDQLPEDPKTGEVIWRDRVLVSDLMGEALDKMVRDHFSQRYQNAAEALQAIATPNSQQSLSSVHSTVMALRSKSFPWRALMGLGSVMVAILAVPYFLKVTPQQPAATRDPSPQATPPTPTPKNNDLNRNVSRAKRVPAFSVGMLRRDVEATFGQPLVDVQGAWGDTRAVVYTSIHNQADFGYLFDINSGRIRQTEVSFKPSVDLSVMLAALDDLLSGKATDEIKTGLQLIQQRQSNYYRFTNNDGSLKGQIVRQDCGEIYISIWESELHDFVTFEMSSKC